MLCYRVIARLDIKGPNLIKGIQYEGLRVLGKPSDFAKQYSDEGADELLYLDTVASLYGRNQLEGLIEESSSETFIPFTVGGGVRSLSEATRLFKCGADRIAVNTGAITSPILIGEISSCAGAQSITVSIEAKRVNGGWEAYTDGGRNRTHKDAVEWAREAVKLGAGEILLTSIDRDGTRKGPDLDLLKAIEVDVPLVYSGGIRLQDVGQVAQYTQGMAIGASLHYRDCTIAQIKQELQRSGKEVRLT